MRTIVIQRLQNGGVSITVNGGAPRTIENANNVIVKALPDLDGVVIKVSDESFRQTVYLADSVTINGDPAPVLLADLITVLNNNVFAGSTTYATPTKLAQTITFPGPAGAAHTAPPITLVGSASSGLAVSYASSDPSVFTISGNVLTPVAAGTANITATQAGNNIYAAATPVVRALTLS